ncbi:MAG TPA: hypothetical protein VF618_26760 [Thermoanaerobaculia bacterium]
MATSTTNVTVKLSKDCLTSIQKGVDVDAGTLTIPLTCAEALWQALTTALKGPSNKKKSKGGKTTTTVTKRKRTGGGGGGRARANS